MFIFVSIFQSNSVCLNKHLNSNNNKYLLSSHHRECADYFGLHPATSNPFLNSKKFFIDSKKFLVVKQSF